MQEWSSRTVFHSNNYSRCSLPYYIFSRKPFFIAHPFLIWQSLYVLFSLFSWLLSLLINVHFLAATAQWIEKQTTVRLNKDTPTQWSIYVWEPCCRKTHAYSYSKIPLQPQCNALAGMNSLSLPCLFKNYDPLQPAFKYLISYTEEIK